ncbi:MAG: DUF3098 domain-containing protein [Flavobacteriales bacterium]|nr:DUF3098 domain-containing protein [Flavobacteriales bacterium]
MEPQKESGKEGFALSTINFIGLIIGLAFIIIGFVLMSGGASSDPDVFNPEVFSSTRITVAPILVLIGFSINIAAIMIKPKKG